MNFAENDIIDDALAEGNIFLQCERSIEDALFESRLLSKFAHNPFSDRFPYGRNSDQESRSEGFDIPNTVTNRLISEGFDGTEAECDSRKKECQLDNVLKVGERLGQRRGNNVLNESYL